VQKIISITLALVALCAVIRVNNPNFFNDSNITNTTRQIGMLGVLAIGVGIVIVSGGIDLSVGSMVGLSAVIFARLTLPESNNGPGYSVWVGVAAALGASILLGAFQGVLIAWGGLQPFMVTLAGMLLFRGLAQTIANGGSISIFDTGFRSIKDRGWEIHSGLTLTYPLLIFAGLAVVFGYLLHATVFGRHVYAIGGNRDAAKYSGVPVRRVELMTYVISAFLAGAAGLLYVAYIGNASHGVGQSYELYAIAAAVLGGCSLRGGEGSMLGIVLGVALFRVIDNGTNLLAEPVKDLLQSDTFIGRRMQAVLTKNWSLDTSKEMVYGAVILGAVLIDQLSQAWRARRRRLAAK
jgi:ribose transport system permease protein